MLKKILVALGFVLFYVLTPSTVNAQCQQVNSYPCPQFYPHQCTTQGVLFCCFSSTSECTTCGAQGQTCCTLGQQCFTAGNECIDGTCQAPSTPPAAVADPRCEFAPNAFGIATAIGCIPFSVSENTADNQAVFVAFFLRWALGIGGGIAFLMILYSGFLIMTSTGNPDRIKAGQELLTSALAGLILLVFSVFVLEFIGIDILRIPGFGQ